MGSERKVYIVHGAGVQNAGTDTEQNSLEGTMRATGAAEHLYNTREEGGKKVAVVLSGGIVQDHLGQKESEAFYMRGDFDKAMRNLIKSNFPGLDEYQVTAYIDELCSVTLEEKSRNSIQNIQSSLTAILEDNEKPDVGIDLSILSSRYHLRRLFLTYKNQLKKKGKLVNLGKYASDEVLQKSEIDEHKNILQQWKEERNARSLLSKVLGTTIETVGSFLARLGQEKLIESLASDLFTKKKR